MNKTIGMIAQEEAEREAGLEYQRELKACLDAGMSLEEATEWASDSAADVYDKAFDEMIADAAY